MDTWAKLLLSLLMEQSWQERPWGLRRRWSERLYQQSLRTSNLVVRRRQWRASPESRRTQTACPEVYHASTDVEK